MLSRTPLPPVILADYLRSAWSVSVTAVLWLCSVPAFGQDIRFSNHLLDRAQAGHVQDQLEVARAFQLGLGVEPNPAEAARWFQKAADQGNPVAQDQLGLLYLLGSGVQRDYREAFKWYQRAALENYPPAQFDLGDLFLHGRGVSPDYQQGVHWMTRAAEQGDGSAAANLAYTYSDPHAGNVDISTAYFWALLALHNPSVLSTPLAPQFAAGLRNRLSPEDATQIEAQVAHWTKTHTPGVGTTANDWFVPLPAKSPSSRDHH